MIPDGWAPIGQLFVEGFALGIGIAVLALLFLGTLGFIRRLAS